MTALVKHVDGWSVTMDGDEPTILDEQLGERLGFSRPRKIRQLIERMISDGILNDSDVRTCLVQTTERGGRPGVSYHLTEVATLLVTARSNTAIANLISRQVAQVFISVRRGLLSTPQQVPVLSTSPLVGDTHYRCELAKWCLMAAHSLNVSIQRIHGAVRKQFRVPGIYQLPVVLYPQARDLVEALAFKRFLLPGHERRLSLVPASTPSTQGVLPFPGGAQ